MVNVKRQTLIAAFSMFGFVVLWTILTDAWNYSAFLFPENLLVVGKYLYGYFSRILWMFPAFFLIFRFDKSLFWSRKQLFSRPKLEPVFIVFMVYTTIYALASMAVKYHSWYITDESLLLITVKFLIVGIGEEVVFRGWGYNLLKRVQAGTMPLIISAFLFTVLHWPAYFIKLFLYGQFDLAGFVIQSISALIYGLLFAVMLKRSETLWNSIIAHFYYDWVLAVLV